MAQPPNEELSALAQQLLQTHREDQSPEPPQQDRVWQRVHHSAFVAPAALLVEPLSQATTTASAAPVSAGVAKAGAVAGAAKGGLLGSLGAKLALAVGLTTSAGAGVIAWQGGFVGGPQESSVQLQEQGQVRVSPGPSKDSPSSSSTSPELLSRTESQGKAAVAPALELTVELRAQLGALSAIDDAIRKKAFRRARTRISGFYTSYAHSPFSSDVSALEMILQCKTKDARSKSKVRGMLKDPRFRRYWSRIEAACL